MSPFMGWFWTIVIALVMLFIPAKVYRFVALSLLLFLIIGAVGFAVFIF